DVVGRHRGHRHKLAAAHLRVERLRGSGIAGPVGRRRRVPGTRGRRVPPHRPQDRSTIGERRDGRVQAERGPGGAAVRTRGAAQDPDRHGHRATGHRRHARGPDPDNRDIAGRGVRVPTGGGRRGVSASRAVWAQPYDNPTRTAVLWLKVGHGTDDVSRTGRTVVLAPEEGCLASGKVLGPAPGSRETVLLEPDRTVDVVHAVVLAGGSAYGLAAAGGVMNWLEEQGRGYVTQFARVPIVPAAVIY